MRGRIVVAAGAALSVGGCASIPDVQSTYYLPRGSTNVSVVRTVGCSSVTQNVGGTAVKVHTLYSTAAVTPTTKYSADLASPATLNFANLDGPLADSAITLEFYDDGRLKSVNSATTGRGTEVVQAVANLVPVAFALQADGETAAERQQAQDEIDRACEQIDAVGGEDRVVTLEYDYSESYAPRLRAAHGDAEPPKPCPAGAAESDCAVAQPMLVRLAPSSAYLAGVDRLLRPICVSFDNPVQMGQPARWNGSRAAPNALHLRRAARFPLSVYEIPIADDGRPTDESCHSAGLGARTRIGGGSALVPLPAAVSARLFRGDDGTYLLPIPRGAPFGSNSLKLGLAESGAVTTLGYGATSGTAGVIGAAGTIGAAATETDAEMAARYQARANLIQQQERLIRCQANRPGCTS
jgi:hypothetical protein